MHYDQVWFNPSYQQAKEEKNVYNCIIWQEKIFDKAQHPFMIKCSARGYRGISSIW